MTRVQYWRLVDAQAKFALKADASKFFLGYLWWILEPLLFVAVFYVVFDIILNTGRGDFLVFLMCGKLPFVWFSKSVQTASNSLANNASLIGKVDVPKTIFPMAKIQECTYRQIGVFTLLAGFLLWHGYFITLQWLWLIPLLILQYTIIIVCAFLGSFLVCYIRDFSILVGLSMTFLMFCSGIFWDVRALSSPEMTQLILAWNPVAFLLDGYRQVLMFNEAPNSALLFGNFAFFGVLLLGAIRLMRSHSRRLALKALS
jgi:lipopolysaccharide transport system permease protein